jgi:glycogen synthase
LPEIAGDAAFYWNDFMHDSMNFVFKKGIESFYSDSSAAEKAILQSKRYDWEHTAKSYLDLYEKA